MQLSTFSFSFRDQRDDCCVLSEKCSWLYMKNKGCIWNEYIVHYGYAVNTTAKNQLKICEILFSNDSFYRSYTELAAVLNSW